MSEKILMTPSTASLGSILSNGLTYAVPVFQRDYSWKEDNWIDLWEDIKVLENTGKDHYMGAVVLQKKGDKHFLVIDGQQRLTTLSIIALAIIKNLQDLIDQGIESEANTDRIAELRRGFLGQRDPASLTYSSKLRLNENNDGFYQTKLLQLAPPINERSLLDSDKLMWKAFQFFYRRVKEHFHDNLSGTVLANFLSRVVGDKMIFIKIEVEDELSAYTLFETLNYRGVDLTVTDLLKNYLFSLLSPVDLNNAKEIWKKIATAIGVDKFPTFLRHFWISRFPLVRQEQLFKALRNSITTNAEVFALLNSLEETANIYVALQEPYSADWNRDQMKRIREFKLFGVKQQIPLLMTSRQKFSEPEFDKLLKLLSVISFRYNFVGSRQANLMEDIYNQASIAVWNNQITTARQVFVKVKELYIGDQDFKNDFASLVVYSYGRTKKMVRYILFELENHISEEDRDFEVDPATIEHILPENAGLEWEEFFPANVQSTFVYRLGNYTLLEDHLNRECGTRPFSEKKEVYSRSQYELSKRISSNEWNQPAIQQRQLQMASWATACWRTPYADTQQ